MTFTKQNAAEMGRRGGRANVEKHGREHMSKIGKKGFQTVTERHFGGDVKKHKRYQAELCAFNYWMQTGIRMKYGPDGQPIFRKPPHPAQRKRIPF